MANQLKSLSSEDVQVAILHSLEASPSGELGDTRKLVLQHDGQPVQITDSMEHQMIIQGALLSLTGKQMTVHTQQESDFWVLSAEGSQIAEQGSHEYRIWEALKDGPLEASELQSKVGPSLVAYLPESARNKAIPNTLKAGQGQAFKSKWVGKHGTSGFVQLTQSVEDKTRQNLVEIKETGTHPDAKLLADLKKRTLCDKQKRIYFSVKRGPNFSTTIQKQETDLTAELIQSGAWKTASFKKYNFDAEGAPQLGGALHPLMKVREEFRNIFFEMGFREMPTNKFVEVGFWNFDALFVPQQHPARELQDTFYIKDPPMSDRYPSEYYERVKKVHEEGGYGSIGYRSEFKTAETNKLVLRTHTTAISAAMLYEIANAPGGFKPAKLFSIDRVFRNEAVDNTHLAEFHQVEGVVVDRNITLGDLIGFMEVFFAKMGIRGLKFKPAYNPYTEPSLEIFSYHEGLGKLVEIGNSGMFRPEMLQPMGFPPDVRALGWGISLERPTMIRYGISNIRDLLGHKIPLEVIEKSGAVRF